MQKKSQTYAGKHYLSIDFVKGILILCVIITHYAWLDNERLWLLFPFWVDMAVPLFMVISGFVYTKSFQKNGTTIEKAYTLESMLKKIIRYSVPFFIVFVVEEIIFSVVFDVPHSPSQLVRDFLNGGHGPGSYYYPIMMQFIFFFPVIYAIIRKHDFRGLILCIFINFLYEVLKSAYGIPLDSYRLLIFRYTFLIAYGCYMATDNYIKHKKLSLLCAFLGVIYITFTAYFHVIPPITRFWTGTSMWAGLYIIPVAKPILLNNCRNRVIESLGRASYHIFLVQMVYYGCYGADLVYDSVSSRWLQLTISLTVCILGGLLFYWLETPFSNLVYKKAYALWTKQREV